MARLSAEPVTVPAHSGPGVDHGPSDRGQSAPAGGGHVVPGWAYLAVYAALLGLAAATVGVSFLDLGALNNVVALGIAIAKGTLVVLVFMHVRWSPRLIPLAAIAGFFWLMLLIAGTLADYFTRGLLGVPGK